MSVLFWMKKYVRIYFYFLFRFYLFDRDRDSQREREHKQGEWEKQAHSRGAWCGARSHNAGIMPWAEGRRLTAVPPRRPSNIFLKEIRGQVILHIHEGFKESDGHSFLSKRWLSNPLCDPSLRRARVCVCLYKLEVRHVRILAQWLRRSTWCWDWISPS